MDQVTVPQFLDVEDKIIGPITIRQFIEMLVGGLLCFIFHKIFDFALFITASLLIFGLTLVVAFIKVNGQSFHYFLLNFLATLKNPKLKVWKKNLSFDEVKKIVGRGQSSAPVAMTHIAKAPVTSSKLSELALIVDTGGVYRGEE